MPRYENKPTQGKNYGLDSTKINGTRPNNNANSGMDGSKFKSAFGGIAKPTYPGPRH
jgi:hypothetical protein